MSWIRAFLELNKSLFLKGLLLLMAFLLGLQIGQSRRQRQWDAEKQIVQVAQAKQEQHVADVARVQNQISKEVSDDYRKKSKLLASRDIFLGSERVLDKSETSSSRLSVIPTSAEGVAGSSPNVVSSAFIDEKPAVGCAEIVRDAAQTTLMLIEFQRWSQRISFLD